MNNRADALDAITGDLADVAAGIDVRTLGDDDLLGTIGAVEALGRRVDALRVASAAEVAHRSRTELGMGGLASRKGCRNANELMQRVTLASGVNVQKRMRLGKATRANMTLVGFEQPAVFPQVSAALAAGQLGVDAATAIVDGLAPAMRRATIDGLVAAETELVAAATGAGDQAPVVFTADEMRIQAQVWQSVLDPDGVEPAEERALAHRDLRLGRESGGLIPLHGGLLPEIAAKFTSLLDSGLSPRTAPSFTQRAEGTDTGANAHSDSDSASDSAAEAVDPRSIGQKRHDVFASLIDAISRSDAVPTVGAAPPTVMVTVRATDVEAGRGVGHIDGLETPISMRAVKQFICAGGSQPVLLNIDGGVLRLWSPGRCFNRIQRRAISARDGGCIIPGCNIPASWSEIHHVVPDRDGGPTQVDNGVCLCWWHHRTIDTSGWQIRMVRGSPQIKAPPWINPNAVWRPATKARTTLTDRIADKLEHRGR